MDGKSLAGLLGIEREQSFRAGRHERCKGATEAGFTNVEADSGNDRIPEDQVHAAFGSEAGKSIKKVAHAGSQRSQESYGAL